MLPIVPTALENGSSLCLLEKVLKLMFLSYWKGGKRSCLPSWRDRPWLSGLTSVVESIGFFFCVFP